MKTIVFIPDCTISSFASVVSISTDRGDISFTASPISKEELSRKIKETSFTIQTLSTTDKSLVKSHLDFNTDKKVILPSLFSKDFNYIVVSIDSAGNLKFMSVFIN